MKANETAVVLIEFQNDFVSEGGALHDGVREVMDRVGTLANAKDLVEKARGRSMIVFVPIIFSPDYSEIANPTAPLEACIANKAFRRGTWGAEIVRDLGPEPGDVVVEGKRSCCGFATTNLDFLLRQKGIRNLAVGGFLTNVCVESTVRTAADLGYNVVTLADCTASLTMEEETHATRKVLLYFSRVMTHDEFLAELE